MTCGVYKITNTVTNEFYIGQSVNVEKRWGVHRKAMIKHRTSSYSGSSPLLVKSCIEHGIEAFVFEVVELCDRDELVRAETQWLIKTEPVLNCVTYINGKQVLKGLEAYLATVRKPRTTRTEGAKTFSD